MKKVSIIIIATALLSMSACSNDDFGEETKNISLSEVTRSTELGWDECNECYLSNGSIVILPWADNSSGSIPAEIRRDVKQSDGWQLLYSNVDIIGCEHNVVSNTGANYILLYNKYTGVLKGFCYANSIQPNNDANWLLTIEQSNTKLFNFVNYFADPANTTTTNQIVLSNISTNGLTGGFDLGWNCFQQELAYDENSLNEHLDISSFAMNQVSYNFSGSYNSTSQGTIVTSSQSSNPIISSTITGIANGFGSYGAEWIKNHTDTSEDKNDDTKPIKSQLASSILQNLSTNPLQTIISTGLNLVFGSLFGEKTSTIQSLEFSTNGQVNITGTSINPSSGYIMPLAGIPLNGTGERLGVWNLAEAPQYLIRTCPELIIAENVPFVGLRMQYKVKGTTQPLIVTKNPDVNKNVTTSHSIVRYEKYNGGNPSFWTPRPGTYSQVSLVNNLSGMSYSKIYNDTTAIIWTMPYNYAVMTANNLPNRTSSNNTPAYDFSTGSFEVRQNIAYKVVTTVWINGTTKAYSCKTFIPVNDFQLNGSDRPHNWTVSELQAAGYYQ